MQCILYSLIRHPNSPWWGSILLCPKYRWINRGTERPKRWRPPHRDFFLQPLITVPWQCFEETTVRGQEGSSVYLASHQGADTIVIATPATRDCSPGAWKFHQERIVFITGTKMLFSVLVVSVLWWGHPTHWELEWQPVTCLCHFYLSSKFCVCILIKGQSLSQTERALCNGVPTTPLAPSAG